MSGLGVAARVYEEDGEAKVNKILPAVTFSIIAQAALCRTLLCHCLNFRKHIGKFKPKSYKKLQASEVEVANSCPE